LFSNRTHRGFTKPGPFFLFFFLFFFFFFFFFLEKLFCARENDFKISIGRSEETRPTGHRERACMCMCASTGDDFNAENRVWRVRAGSPETTQRFQIADPISVHVWSHCCFVERALSRSFNSRKIVATFFDFERKHPNVKYPNRSWHVLCIDTSLHLIIKYLQTIRIILKYR